MRKKEDVEARAGKIRCVVLDVDGVLTDGRIALGGGGSEWKFFDVRDGLGIAMAVRLGVKVVFMTGRDSEAVRRRAAELSVHRVLQGVRDKGEAMGELLRDEGLDGGQVAYMGDDLPDLPAMGRAGLSGAVADAAPEVLGAADWVARRPGGRGAVREFLEFVLRSRGLWDAGAGKYGG